jgi:two-component system, chemotaxis family, sensor kinase CheA
MSVDLSQFHEAFFEEALVSLDQAEGDLLLLEKGIASKENLDSAFRAIHSIKGSAATLGFTQMGLFSHELEAVLDRRRASARDQNNQPTEDEISTLLAALDLLRTQVANAQRKNGDVAQPRVDALIGKLQKFSLADTASPLAATSQSVSKSDYQIRFAPHVQLLDCGNDPLRYIDSLAELGSLQIQAFWEDDASEMNRCELSWNIILSTEKSSAQIHDLFSWVSDVCDLTIGPVQSPVAPSKTGLLKPELTDSGERTAPRSNRAIQVQSEKVDAVLSQLSDLAVAQAEIENRVVNQEIIELFQRLSRQTSQLQDAILAMRMSPIKSLFRRFERVVRDAERELGKRVAVKFVGEDNELDSSLIDRLIDPITHLMRNALDHGIESPSERISSGKPEVATLVLTAEQKSNSFVIRIEDDGRGLAIEKIRQKAIERGLATSATKKTNAQWAQMIFQAGFSTSEGVNQWSGRGVGLDAVAAAIDQLSGHIDLQTTPGCGTSIAITLPLTMAITEALLVEAGNERYAIAMNHIAECLHTDASKIAQLPNDQELYKYRTGLVPYADLCELMAFNFELAQQAAPIGTFPAIVITSGKELAVIRVTQIIGQRQVVIKSIEKNLGQAKYCSSATLLGDGRVVFVLDPTQIINAVGLQQALQI